MFRMFLQRSEIVSMSRQRIICNFINRNIINETGIYHERWLTLHSE
uniref:Uncharacterized protein n=1 Tax=Anguilla anguilla TaxID=7936 RepID=A0A0E9S2N7_ANGAN